MIEHLSPQVRRYLALGLLAMLGLAVDTAIIAPWREQRAAYRQQIETDRNLHERYRQGLAAAQAEVAAITALRDDPALTEAFLDPADDDLATARLQDLIKSAAADEGAEVTSLQMLPARAADGVRAIAVSATLETTMAALVPLIHRLEGDRPLVRVRALEVQSASADNSVLTAVLEAQGLMPEAVP